MIQPLLTKLLILWMILIFPLIANAQIAGDRYVCPGDDPQGYTISTSGAGTYTWSLPDGGGSFTSTPTTNSATVNWGSTPGTYRIRASFVANATMVDEHFEAFVTIEGPVALACNNVVNISMDIGCEVFFEADMLLEDPAYPNESYEVLVEDAATGELISERVLDGAYVGRPLKVIVRHKCSGNTCWSTVNLEDKFIPELLCDNDITVSCTDNIIPDSIGFPLPNGTAVTRIGDNIYQVGGFDQCGTATLEYQDSISNRACDQGFANVIYRKWKFTDSGYSSTGCTDQIFVTGPSMASVGFPDDFDGPTALQCKDRDTSEGWISNPDGTPSTETTGAPFGAHCATIQISYFDTKFSSCGNDAFKLKRLWHIIDWCTGAVLTHTQLISVVDIDPPICISAPTELIAYTTPGDCVTSFNVPAPIIAFECSEYNISVGYKNKSDDNDPYTSFTRVDTPQNSDGSFTIPSIDAPQDSIWIIYIVTDACGNEVLCLNEAAVVDNEEPVPVCDQYTTVSLNSEGWAFADIKAFDDGSVDNCSINYMEVRRLNGSCGVYSDWGHKVKFCCDDIGITQMVELRVFDHSNNSNSCMVEVTVQDNNPLIISDCPPNETVPCGADLSDLTQYGVAPIGSTVCGSSNTNVNETININDCGAGSVIRRFTVEDSQGNLRDCQQVITVGGNLVFSEDNVTWPQDLFVRDCPGGSDINPDNLEAQYVPSFTSDGECSNIVMDYKDVPFQFVEDVCVKILREWTIINWCQFDPFDHTAGTYYYSQVIKINDQTPPEFTNSCDDRVVCAYTDGCEGTVTLGAKGTDLCTPINELRWSYNIDIDNDGSNDISRNGMDATGSYPYGTHRVHFAVEDGCGNRNDDCSFLVTINDCKNPTPYCVSELITVIMQEEDATAIWASDFGLNSFDNCTAEEDLRFSFTANVNDRSRTITCADLEGESEKLFNYEIYVTDEAGNTEFCYVALKVQDNQGFCLDTPSEGGPDDEEEDTSIAGCGDDPISANLSVSTDNACEGQEVILRANNVSGCNEDNSCTLTWLDYNGDAVGTGQVVSVLGGSTDEENVYTLIPVYNNECDTIITLGTVSFLMMNEDRFVLPDTLSSFCVNLIPGTNVNLGDSYNGIPGAWSGDVIDENGNLTFETTSGSGSHQVTFTTDGVCGDITATSQIVILEEQQVDIVMLDTICQGGVDVILDQVSGSDGIYFIDGNIVGLSGDSIIIDGLADGEHILEFYSEAIQVECLYGSSTFIVLDCDNMSSDTTLLAQVAGSVYTYDNHLLDNVAVELNSQVGGQVQTTTNSSGEYAFGSVNMYNDYVITPSKDDDYLNGVSTLDLVLIQNHILGSIVLDSPYKLIAADVNESATITASDLVLIRKLILGQIDALPSSMAWKFVDAQHNFAGDDRPFPHREFISLPNLDANEMHNDFVAVKMGDVNQSVDLGFTNTEIRSDRAIILRSKNQTFRRGDIVEVPFMIEDNDVLGGLQASLDYNIDVVELIAIDGNIEQLDKSHLHLTSGNIAMSWNLDNPSQASNHNLFTLKFKALAAGKISDVIEIANTNLRTEIYTIDSDDDRYQTSNLILQIGDVKSGNNVMLYQNIPNPFSQKTIINFYMPYRSTVTLRVVDLNGKVLIEQSREASIGNNSIELDLGGIETNGILYYHLETDQEVATRKMIKIN